MTQTREQLIKAFEIVDQDLYDARMIVRSLRRAVYEVCTPEQRLEIEKLYVGYVGREE